MIRRQYVDVSIGQVHVASCGEGPPVALLHQTPRSWDEFREVMPLLADHGWRALALDTAGMGASSPLPGPPSIERYAAVALEACDELGLERFALAGHHTGAVIAMEIAAAAPGRVVSLVLSSCPWVDEAARERRRSHPPVDQVAAAPDGRHLRELWQGRQAFYPPGRADLLSRFVRDALAASDPAAGHRAVGSYRMEDRIGLVRAPVLCVGHDADPHAFGDLHEVAGRIRAAQVAVVEGGMVPLEWRAERFALLVAEHLARRGDRASPR